VVLFRACRAAEKSKSVLPEGWGEGYDRQPLPSKRRGRLYRRPGAVRIEGSEDGFPSRLETLPGINLTARGRGGWWVLCRDQVTVPGGTLKPRTPLRTREGHRF
jgi:hypothetical protein